MRAFALALLWPAMILSAAEPSPWKVDPQPALAPGLPGSWDDYAIASPTILRLPDKWMLFYEGIRFDRDGLHRGGGLAESRDGIAWTKNDQNPLLNPVPQASGTLAAPSLTRWNEKFWAIFVANDDPFHREKVLERFDPIRVWTQLARSDDGLLWKTLDNVKSPAGLSDFFPVRPCLYGDEQLLHLWWIGPSGERERGLLHSVSRNGENWSQPNQQPARELDSREICCARVYPSGNYYILSYVAYDETKRQYFAVTKTSPNARSWAAGGPPEFPLPEHWMHSPPALLFQPNGARLFYCAKEPDETVVLRSAWCSKSGYVSR